jgi:hypothetical protein
MNRIVNEGFDTLPHGMSIIRQSEDPVEVIKREAERNARPIQSIKHYRTVGERGNLKFDAEKSMPLPQWPGFNHAAVSGCRPGRVEPINQVFDRNDIRWFKYEGPGPMTRTTFGKPANRQKAKASARGRKKALKYGWRTTRFSFVFSTTQQWYAPQFRINWTGWRANMTIVCRSTDVCMFNQTQLEFTGNASK